MPKKKAPADDTTPVTPTEEVPPADVLDQPVTPTETPVTPTAPERPLIQKIAQSAIPKAIVRPKVGPNYMCEFCGTDCRQCEHYKDFIDPITRECTIVCSYCNRGDVLFFRRMNVYSLPESPNVYIFVCEDMKCQDAHIARYTSPSLSR